MTRLMMHWHLVKGPDGKRHLDMTWESTHTCMTARRSRAQRQRGKTQIASRPANTWH